MKLDFVLDDFEKDEILNIDENVLETIVGIVKEMITTMPLYTIDANTVREIIEENFGDN